MAGEQRINIRASQQTVDRLKRAAAARKMSLTTLMLTASNHAADRILAELSDSGDTE